MSADPIARGLATRARIEAAAAQATANAAQIAAAAAQSTANAALAGAAAKTQNTQALIAAIRNNGFLPQPAARTPAANIPVIAVSAANANSAINGRINTNPMVLLSDNKIGWLAGPTILNGSASWASRGAWYGASRATQYSALEFSHTGTDLDVSILGSFYQAANNVRILVNDRIAGYATVPQNTGSYYYVRLTFPSSATRRIRIEGAGGRFRGVNAASVSEIAATGRNYPLIPVLGDSFDEGTGAANACDGEAVSMVRALGGNIVLGAVGGTGILNPATGGKVAWTDATRMTDLTMAGVTDALTGAAAVPAMGVVHMSVNDNISATTALWSPYGTTFQDAVNNRVWALIDAWVTANPAKPLVFFGPTFPNGTPPLDMFRIRDATQEACWSAASSNVWFIDRFAAAPILRSGNPATTTDQAWLYTNGSGDTTHPNQAGHNLDALWMAAQLRTLIMTQFA